MNINILVFSLFRLCCWCLRQLDISTRLVEFLWIIIRQTILGRYIISLFDYNIPTWIQVVIVEQVILKKNLNFNTLEETCIFIFSHKAWFWHFFSKWKFAWQYKNGNLHFTFGSEMLELLVCIRGNSLCTYKDEMYIIGFVSQLNWN